MDEEERKTLLEILTADLTATEKINTGLCDNV